MPERNQDGGPRARRPSESAVRERTGRGWDEWFAVIDAWGPDRGDHAEMARRLGGEGVDGWWAQSITVAYEHVRGLRQPGERPDGTFTAGASTTVRVPVERLYAAVAERVERERWLPGTELAVRTSRPPKGLRADRSGGGRVVADTAAAGEGRSRISIAEEKLPDAAAAADAKGFWRERLTVLKGLLETE